MAAVEVEVEVEEEDRGGFLVSTGRLGEARMQLLSSFMARHLKRGPSLKKGIELLGVLCVC